MECVRYYLNLANDFLKEGKQWIKANYPKECAPKHKTIIGADGCYDENEK